MFKEVILSYPINAFLDIVILNCVIIICRVNHEIFLPYLHIWADELKVQMMHEMTSTVDA